MTSNTIFFSSPTILVLLLFHSSTHPTLNPAMTVTKQQYLHKDKQTGSGNKNRLMEQFKDEDTAKQIGVSINSVKKKQQTQIGVPFAKPC